MSKNDQIKWEAEAEKRWGTGIRNKMLSSIAIILMSKRSTSVEAFTRSVLSSITGLKINNIFDEVEYYEKALGDETESTFMALAMAQLLEDGNKEEKDIVREILKDIKELLDENEENKTD